MAEGARRLEPEPTPQPPRPLPRRAARRIALRVLADAVAVSGAMFLASIIRFELLPGAPAARFDYTFITALATPVWLLLFWAYGLYEPRQVLSPVTEAKQVFHGVIAGAVAILIADSALNMNLARGWALLTIATGIVSVGGERLVVRKTLHYLRRRGGDPTRTIIVGANHEARTIAKTIAREAWLGYEVLGFVDDTTPAGEKIDDGGVVLGAPAELKRIIAEQNAALVLIAATAFDAERVNRLLWQLQDAGVDLQITSGTVDLIASRMIVQSVAGVPLLYVRRTGMDRAQRTMKRAMDVVGAVLIGTLLAPALLSFALWIRLDSRGPSLFKQVRIGRDGQPFLCWKFRTMYADAEQRRAELEHLNEGPGLLFKLKDDPRVTRAGKVLRRYSLDELPQLWNVLRGQMSFVGPRPALPAEVEQYDDWVRNRLRVKPGMTGLWQVSGRAETTFSDYVRYDLFYIQNWSLSLDLWVLWRTLRAITSGEGAH